MHRTVFTGLGAVLVTLVLTGCAASAGDGGPGTAPTPFVAGDVFVCNGLAISRDAVEARVPVSEISEPGRVALAEAVWDDGSPLDLPAEEGWYVASVTDDLVAVMRDVEAAPDPVSPGAARDREVQSVAWVDDATNLTPGWYGASSGPCALTLDLGDLTVPAVELQVPPDPLSREVRLLVTEETCNSGMDAEGRIEVLSLEETDAGVSLILGVRPRDGGQTCPSNPSTPFTLTLTEPLGERQIVDASLATPRPLTVRGPLPEAIAAGSDCDQISLMLRVTPSPATAGDTVTVTTTPEHCPITDALAGDVIVRLGTGDTPTGARIERGATQPVAVTVPAGLAGDGYLMLVPDQDCADVLTTADCHYPFAEITIVAPLG